MRFTPKTGAIVAILLVGVAALTFSQSGERAPKTKALRTPAGEFRHKVYRIDDHRTVTVFEVPDQFGPNRCWVFENDDTKATTMHCGAEPGEMPTHGPELER